MFTTHVKAVRDIRNHYPDVSQLIKKQDNIIVTNNGKCEAVIIPYEQFEDYQEYAHKRYVAKKLAEAEAAGKDPNAWLELDDDQELHDRAAWLKRLDKLLDLSSDEELPDIQRSSVMREPVVLTD
ncbi:MAG: type II toxin-antitoxin system Phd/YefM family antitoxin [Firmicutes bacterium]|nr:type II toxin-antitoxin system Phd/YefM family antitoxin [Bacillota bacterium]